MNFRKSSALLLATILCALPASRAWAHWCNDLWQSSYNLTVRPDSDTSPKEVYVQNNMGYQLTNVKLTATASSGSVTLTAPSKLTVSGTLLPGEKGTWKISSGSPAKIEDITFSVSFGSSGQSGMYPTSGAKAVMIVKTDGSLVPQPPAGLTASSGNSQSRSIVYSALADWDDLDGGLDKLLNLYCAGRASWGSSDGVTQANCKDNQSTTCPTTKPTSGTGSKFDYIHLWAAGALAVRKGSLGARLATLRERLKCGANDGDTGFAGFAIFILGYLGDDAGAKTFLQTQVTAGGDLGTISKAALYMMGDTAQKADVQAGAKSSSVFVKAACAAALGIVDNDDASVTSSLIPSVTWTEPDTSDDGKGMYAAHVLEIAAYSRRGWVPKGVGTGAVSFYGETGSASTGGTSGSPGSGGRSGTGGATGTGGVTGSAGATGNRDAGAGGGKTGSGGVTGVAGSTGTAGASGNGGAKGGSTGSSGTGVGHGGATGQGGTGPGSTGGTTGGVGGDTGSTVTPGGGSTGSNTDPQGGEGGTSTPSTETDTTSAGCKCSVGHPDRALTLYLLGLAGLALALVRRRRR